MRKTKQPVRGQTKRRVSRRLRIAQNTDGRVCTLGPLVYGSPIKLVRLREALGVAGTAASRLVNVGGETLSISTIPVAKGGGVHT